MKRKKSRKNKSKVYASVCSLLFCLVYIPIMFCMFFGSKQMWVEFAVSLSVSALSFILLIIYTRKRN